MKRPCVILLGLCVLSIHLTPASGQTITIRDEHPRVVFTTSGQNGTRTFQTVRDLYNAGGPFRSEVYSWAVGTYGNSNPIQQAARFVVTGDVSRAESALDLMVANSLSFGGTESHALKGAEWAMAYDWIYSAWDGTTPPSGLSTKLATIEGKIGGWVASALNDLDSGGPSLWHGRAALAASAWTAAVALPPGGAYTNYRSRAFNHWQQALKATHAAGAWPEGPTYWATNRAINFPLAYMSYTSGITSAPSLAVSDPLEDLHALGLWQAYMERGDGTFNRYGDVSSQVYISNGTIGRSIDVYAMVTQDPALAAFAQHARDYRSTLLHSEYAWMYPVGYDPNQPKPAGYDPANPEACLAGALPNAMLFGADATGFAVMRQGWSSGDTQISFKAGDYLAHHGHYDQGTFTIFKHAPLVINSGGYGPYTGVHRLNYYVRTVSKNGILVQRPDEIWTPPGTAPPGGYTNDGGQRIVKATGSTVSSYENWLANKNSGKHYESGDVTAFDNVDDRYSYVAADLTAAYNSTQYDSEGQGGKVSRVTRQMMYLQDSDVMVVFDRVESTNASYRKKWLLHTPNKFVGGSETVLAGSSTNGIVEVDGDTIAGGVMSMTNGAGKLYLQTLCPTSYTVRKVGGTGYRYYVEDDGNDLDGLDGSNHDDYTERYWHDYGDWRVEIFPDAPAISDVFLNVLTPRNSAAAAPAPAELLANDAVVTAAKIGTDVIAFGTSGPIGASASYDLPTGGSFRHLVVDLDAEGFYRIDAGAQAMGLFANASGVLAFDHTDAAAHTVALTALADPAPGDANLDRICNVFDLAVLAMNYGMDGRDWLTADFTGDRRVDVFDLAVLATHYGNTTGRTVPEPTALALLIPGLLAATGPRGKRRLR